MKAFQSTGPSDYAWFPGIHSFFTRGLCVRFSAMPDAALPNIPTNRSKYVVSPDMGSTWGSAYVVPGIHTSNEPLTLVNGSDILPGSLSAPGFTRGPGLIPGVLKGGAYQTNVQPGLRSVKCDYVEVRAGGTDYFYRGDGCTISGFTRDVSAAYWFGTIVQRSAAEWVSPITVVYVADAGQTTCECIRSTDQGQNWTLIGTVAAAGIGGEGFDEPAMMTVPGSTDLICVSRVGAWAGTTKVGRTFSTNGGATWGAVDRIPPYGKAPFLWTLGNNDVVCTAGGWSNGGVDTSIKGLGLWLETDAHGTWSTAPWGILEHHNATITDPNQQFFLGGVTGWGSRGYSGICDYTRLSNGSRLLICYDRSAGADGIDTQPNRIYVVDVTITRG